MPKIASYYYYYYYLHFFDFFERLSWRGVGRERGRERTSVGWLPKWLQYLGFCPGQNQDPGIYSRSPIWMQGPKQLSCPLLFSRHISRKQRSIQNTHQHSDMGYRHYKWQFRLLHHNIGPTLFSVKRAALLRTYDILVTSHPN